MPSRLAPGFIRRPRSRRPFAAALLSAAFGLLALPAASVATDAPGTVSLDQTAYTAHENMGQLTITITRTDPSGTEYVRYGVKQQDAQSGLDFDAVPNSVATFQPGQTSFSFNVTIHDLGMNGPPVHALAYLFGSWPQHLGTHNAVITILRDDPLDARNPADLLAPSTTTSTTVGTTANVASIDPLRGAQFYTPGSTGAAGAAEMSLRQSNPAWAKALSVLADAPTGYRFWFWNTPGDPSGVVAHYLEQAEKREPGTTVQLTTYSLVHGKCGSTANLPFAQRYLNWVRGLARGIGNFHVVLFFELDSIITAPCLSPKERYIRFHDELAPAIQILEQDPHLAVYVDGGAADANPWRTDARFLFEAGVKSAQGFVLNPTHFDWTTKELAYGQRIARALGGVHFVINTGENGRGPLRPANLVQDGNEVLCNPQGRGLGPFSTTTGYTYADAFFWTAVPGNSGGACRAGAPPTAQFWTAYAVSLVQNANFTITGPHEHLLRDGHFIPEQP
jgi:endoglucanase